MAEEHCSDNAFVPETQMDPVDYIDISSDMSDILSQKCKSTWTLRL